MLKVENLTFSYDQKRNVLDNVSLHIHEGIFTALLGPNGTGKSTLIKNILQLLKYKQGSICADGIDVSTLSITDRAKLFSYVPQDLELGNMNVFDAVLLGRKNFATWGYKKEDFESTQKVISKIGLESLTFRNVQELSGGERQKVAIARAINQGSRYLFLDEPISNLDIKNQMECLELLRSIMKEYDLTIMASMHDLNMALRYSDHFLLLKDNKVYKNAVIDELSEEDIKACYGIDSEIMKKDGIRILIPKGDK